MDHGILGAVDLGWRIVRHSIVGPLPLAVAIVTGFGLLMKSARAQTVEGDTTSAIFHAVVGLLLIPVSIALLFLWSVAVDGSFSSAVLVWSVFVIGGCANLAIKRHHRRADVAVALHLAA